MKRKPILSLLLFAFIYYLPFQLSAQVECHSIDFEDVPETGSVDGLILDNQYLASLGVRFELVDIAVKPHLAQVGTPVTAFGTAYGNDTPAPGQNIGDFFLTDSGELAGIKVPPLLLKFSVGVISASGMVLDIDFDEVFVIQALAESDSVLAEVTLTADDLGAGDGIATSWSFKRMEADIFSIKITGSRNQAGAFAMAVDNFQFCIIGSPTATLEHHQASVRVYPNPAHDLIWIESPEFAIKAIVVQDINGRQLSAEINITPEGATVSASHQGVLLVQIITDQGAITRKVIMN